MKENIENMLTYMSSGDYDKAREQFMFVASQKAADALEAHKIEVADTYFNGSNPVKEDTEQGNE
jgi:hypothetical protein